MRPSHTIGWYANPYSIHKHRKHRNPFEFDMENHGMALMHAISYLLKHTALTRRHGAWVSCEKLFSCLWLLKKCHFLENIPIWIPTQGAHLGTKWTVFLQFFHIGEFYKFFLWQVWYLKKNRKLWCQLNNNNVTVNEAPQLITCNYRKLKRGIREIRC